MSSTLSSAAQDRKARLAQLKSLKRKQPDEYQEGAETAEEDDAVPKTEDAPLKSTDEEPAPAYLSGRNYDHTTRGPKLGFEVSPSEGQATIERRAALLAETTKAELAKTEAEDKPLDLFKLQPKKPNWDLKRNLDRKLEVLNVRTENAIARLVRERIAAQQGKAKAEAKAGTGGATNGSKNGDEGEEVGIEGNVLVEATKEREREDEEDARKEKELEEAYLDGP